MKKKENFNEKSQKSQEENKMEVEDNSWTKMRCKGWNEEKKGKEEGWKEVKSKGWKIGDQLDEKMIYEREKNFYDTLSDDEDQLENKFEKMEVVEEEDKKMKSKDEFVASTTKKEKPQQRNKKMESEQKSEIKRQ